MSKAQAASSSGENKDETTFHEPRSMFTVHGFNGKIETVEVTPFDTKETILLKYAFHKDAPLNYLTWEGWQPDQGAIHIKYIIDELADLKEADVDEFGRLATEYGLSLEDVALLWIQKEPEDRRKYDILNTLEITTFTPIHIRKRVIPDFIEKQNTLVKEVRESYKNYAVAVGELLNHHPVETSHTRIESFIVDFIFDFSADMTLENLFDELSVTPDIPFMCLSTPSKKWYKIYRHAPYEFLDAWLTEMDIVKESGIHFMLKMQRARSKVTYIHGTFQTNSCRIDCTPNNIGQIREKITANLNQSRGLKDNKIINENQVKIRASFDILKSQFNKILVSYAIDNNTAFKYFIFINEVDKSINKKGVFKCYFLPGHQDEINSSPHDEGVTSFSLRCTFNTEPTDGESESLEEDKFGCTLNIRFNKAKDINQVNQVKHTLCRLWSIYIASIKNTLELYESILPSTIPLIEVLGKNIMEETEDKKSGRRIRALKKFNPNIFRSRYSSVCQPRDQQPYIASDADRKALANTHKIMKMKDHHTGETFWFACEPREASDASKEYIYPGFSKNNEPSGGYNKDYPFVPCCFKIDQYTKESSTYNKYIASKKGEAADAHDLISHETRASTHHILGSKKLTPLERFANIPFFLSDIVGEFEPKIILYRFGVIESPDSFIHCLERANIGKDQQPYHTLQKISERKARVHSIREELALRKNFSIAKQELVGYTDNEIRNMLKPTRGEQQNREDGYLNPRLWIRLLESRYKVNVLLFKINKKFPNGNVVIPKASYVHLQPLVLHPQTVLINMFENPGGTLGGKCQYQCELIVNHSESDHTFIFETQSPFIQKLYSILQQANQISAVTPVHVFDF